MHLAHRRFRRPPTRAALAAPRDRWRWPRILAALCCAAGPVRAATTLVTWENLVAGTTPDSAALVAADGATRLPAGSAADGDGAVVVLGYFTGAGAGATFTGDWVPLTGPRALHGPFRGSTIGDTGSNAAGAFGFFSLQTVFDTGVPESLQNAPPEGTRLAVAIFSDTTIAASSHCNIATNDAWRWVAPGALPSLVQCNLNDAGTLWLGGGPSARITSVPVAAYPGFPAIQAGVTSQGLDAGDPLVVSVTATGTGDLSYQWFKDGSPLAGETGPTLTRPAGTTADSGAYFVRVSNAAGAVDSAPANIAVHDAPAHLVNLSTRGYVGTLDSILIPGFVALGTGGKTVLLRAIGPTLAPAPFNVPGVLADPQLSLRYQETGVEIAANDDWGVQNAGLPDSTAVAAAMAASGAFPIPADSKDAALVYTAPVGTKLTALVSGAAGGTGVALAEIFVVDDGSEPEARLVNISTRGFVGTGDNVMIPGFFLGQGGTRRLLIRAVGPTLAALPGVNLPPVIPDPVIRVRRSADQSEVAFNDNWEDDAHGPEIAQAAAQVQAFALPEGSTDAALILVVPPSVPGAFDRGFTVEVMDRNGATGLAIAEIYELP